MIKMKFTAEQIEQKRKARKFSIPYNNSGPRNYIEKVVDPHVDNIDSIYFEIPNNIIGNHANVSHRNCDINKFFRHQAQTYEFTNLIRSNEKYRHIKLYVTLNGATYTAMSQYDKQIFVGNFIREFVNAYQVDGVICADMELAAAIHDIYPLVEVQSSCNTYQWLPRQVKLWCDRVGTVVHNPPREILRNTDVLKYMRKQLPNIKFKCLVNESCVYGCPQNINHAHYIAAKTNIHHESYCLAKQWPLADIFRTNFIIPRWLKYYDDYVDIFKLSSRALKTELIANIVDAYVNERDDVSVCDLFTSRYYPVVFEKVRKEYGFDLLTSDIPDALITCNCERCDSGCKICDKAAQKILKRYNLTADQFTQIARESIDFRQNRL